MRLLDTYGLRVGAALIAASALGGALYRVPALERFGHRYANAPGMSVESADLDPLKYFVSLGAIVNARNAIPRGATYTVVVGRDPPLAADPNEAMGLAHAVRATFRMWLLPLRYTPNLHRAQWVVAYHQTSATLGIKYSHETRLSYDANLLEAVR